MFGLKRVKRFGRCLMQIEFLHPCCIHSLIKKNASQFTCLFCLYTRFLVFVVRYAIIFQISSLYYIYIPILLLVSPSYPHMRHGQNLESTEVFSYTCCAGKWSTVTQLLFCFFKMSCMLVFRPVPVPSHTIYPSPANASVGFGWLSAWSEVKIWNIYPYWGMIIDPLSFLYPQNISIYIPSMSLTRRFECDIWNSRRLLKPMSIEKNYDVYHLVGGFKHEFYFPFHKKGMSSFPLTNSYCSEG